MRAKRAFEDVYLEHFSYIYNFIYMHVLHQQTAEDLTSDTFIKALDAYERYDPALAGERTWLCTIANRLLINHYRSKQSNKADLVGDDVLNIIPDTDEALLRVADDTTGRVYRLLQCLTEEERRLLVLRYYQDAKNPEIAEALGINPKAVSERYRRLLVKCKRIMENLGLGDLSDCF